MITKRRPTHPGLVLKHDVLEPLNLTVAEAARRLGVTRRTLSELINPSEVIRHRQFNTGLFAGASPSTMQRMMAV